MEGKEKKRGKPKKQIKEAKQFASGAKVETLVRGRTYKGTVIESFEYRFIVLVEKHCRVLVHNWRFLPLANQGNVPISCVIARGDEVFLTAIKNKNISRYDEEWIAVKCWIELEESIKDGQTANDNQIFCDGTVTQIDSSHMYLSSNSKLEVVARSDSIVLHGLPVDSVHLNEIFRIGDNLSYEIDATLPPNVRMHYAKKAWYGSRSNEDTCEAANQLLKFCMTRNIRKEIFKLLINLQNCGETHESKENLIRDEFDFHLPYIKLDGSHMKPKKKSTKDFPKLSPKTLQGVVEHPNSGVKQHNKTDLVSDIKLTNRFDVLYMDGEPDVSEPSDAVTMGTQTYSKGEIFNTFEFDMGSDWKVQM